MSPDAPARPDPRAVRILAKSLLRDLRESGFDDPQVLALTSELLGLVAAEVRSRRVSASSART